jgi:hypothetical protein
VNAAASHPSEFALTKLHQISLMKRNSLKIILALALVVGVLGTTLRAQGPKVAGSSSTQVVEGKAISKADAEKKYPPPKSGYPTGERDPHDPSGIVLSPYPPHTRIDCSKINHGTLCLDTVTNKVFVRP